MSCRPDNFDYSQPDPEWNRCPVCNPHGMCRTGNMSVGYSGTSTTVVYAVRCYAGCFDGLKTPFAQDGFEDDLTT